MIHMPDLSFHIWQAIFGIDWTKNGQPTQSSDGFESVLYRNFFFSSRTDVRFVAVYLHNFLRFFYQSILHLHKDSASSGHEAFEFYSAARILFEWYHVDSRRLRRSTTGLHTRLREYDAWLHFFPRSVGLGPTDSWAVGAFVMEPSMLCHFQAIPSISSYSASPFFHNFRKKPSFPHLWK